VPCVGGARSRLRCCASRHGSDGGGQEMCAWEVGDCRQELVALSRVGERRRERREGSLGFLV
jgi:hypothetical protein